MNVLFNKGLVRKQRRWYLVPVLIVLSVTVLQYHKIVTIMPLPIDHYMSYVLYPVMYLQHTVVAPIKLWFSPNQSPAQLQKTITQLQHENEQLRTQLIEHQALQTHADAIDELIAFKKRYDCSDAILAQVLMKNISATTHFYIIDAGSNKGIKKNMVAVYKDMLIGKIVEVYPLYSKLLLISDQRCKVSAYCARTSCQGIHVGSQASEGAQLMRVSHLHEVCTGDLILSTGDGLVFPKGFALGVVETARKQELFYDITTKFLVDFHQVPYCYIIAQGR